MAVERYECGSCDHSSESYNYTNGNCCPHCLDTMIPRGGTKKPPIRSRRRRNRHKMDPEAAEHYRKAERELLSIKESEERHFLERKIKQYEEDVKRKEAYKRKTEKAPVVFHAYDARPPGEIHENETLFSGIEVQRIDPLDHTDYQKDSDVPEMDDYPDVPFGVLIGLERM